MKKKYQVLVGETKSGELYFLEIEPKSENHDYFSMSGFTIKPIREEDAIKQVRESLEDGELWREAVKAEATSKGLNDWVEEVLAIDGELSGFDNSLYREKVGVNNEDWLFESESCGQHEEGELKRYHLPEIYYKKLNTLWKKNHLAKENPKEWAGLLDDIQNEGWLRKEKEIAFIEETIKNNDQ